MRGCEVGKSGVLGEVKRKARRKRRSMCARAAVVAGEVVGSGSVREVEGEATGRGKWVARNM